MENGKKAVSGLYITIMILVIIGGLVLLIIGLDQYIPSRTFSFYGLEKYVGGDAYNAIIESGIRGGEIAGAMTTKAMYICSGSIIMVLGLLGLKRK